MVAAVSGGGDSLALLFLLKSYLQVHAPHTRLTAVTVDHRLRPESAAEALAVARLCQVHGICHRTVAWEGNKPRSGVIAAARDARHRLLSDAAVEAGSDVVMTGHTLNDQAETVAMRRERRSDGEGLSGIADATLYDGKIWFCRPLLGIRRAALREWLARTGIAWIDDPSNENPKFERVRVRAALDARDIETLAGQADDAGRRRVALALAAARLIEEFVTCPTAGLFRVDPRMLSLPVTETTVLALRALLATAGGTAHLPDRERVQALADRLGRGSLRATLSRAVVDARPDGIWIRREARNLPTVMIGPETVRWDGRWHLFAQDAAHGLSAASIGDAASPEAAGQLVEVPQSLARAAFSAEPGVFDRTGFVGHAASLQAGAAGIVASPLVAPHASYIPSFDLALADALRRLIGLPPLPAAPWKDHIAT